MLSKAHLFVVDNNTMPIHIQKGFCGIVKVNRLNKAGNLNNSYFGQLADLMNINTGDLVFFYMQIKDPLFELSNKNEFNNLEQGYFGIFKVVDKPFYCEEEIRGSFPFKNYYIFGSKSNPNYSTINEHYASKQRTPRARDLSILVNRIPIEPIIDYTSIFENRVVDDNHAYVDKTDEGQLYTLLFKKIKRIGEERSITPILPEEASKISRLLFKQERRKFPLNIDRENLHRCNNNRNIVLDIEIDDDKNELRSESMLEGYLLKAINSDEDLGTLSEVIGDYSEIEFCGNQIQYGISGNKVDILLLHRKVIGGSTSYRYKATVLELKKGRIHMDSIEQIIDYQKWVAQLVTYNNIRAIQPILIGKKPSNRMAREKKRQIKNLLNKIKEIGISAPIFFEYKPINKSKIIFEKYNIDDCLK